MEKKYGLQLRVKPSQQKKLPPRPPLSNPLGFRGGDDDDTGVEAEISRQAYKNKSLRDVEEQHKKALEEDPSAFDYDGVYDQMKQQVARPIASDRLERKPKYIQAIMEKAKQREREHEVVYERKLNKERSQDDHLYAGKDKYVTSAYKKKLAEQAKWMEEERLRELQEEKEDVTKKSDLTDFYFSLEKNVAFGGVEAELTKPKKIEETVTKSPEEIPPLRNAEPESTEVIKSHESDTTSPREQSLEADAKPVSSDSTQEKAKDDPSVSEQPRVDHHKRTQDALAAAKERFKARKMAKIN
ncbi:hypothetical protein ACH5RR_021195 [Cinchona calisaya]|uniref:Nuclear speckle splicing regulatory protein 1 N-terminal domain-containing protein n=1 Tax=Cinchona calisaya TaxID=153742 RepID=A0ABD2ZIE4_9GENT